MTSMSDERILLRSGGLTLTTHRVRSEAERGGKMQITSIMLEELCSCETRFTSHPFLLILAGLIAVAGLLSSNLVRDSSGLITALVFAGILLAIYFATRKEVISLASAAAQINLQRQQTEQQDAGQLIDQIEAAKNQRYLLARAATANEVA
ncbi:hypothetical protein HUU39_13590 [candidate division KSB1 bacterium]|nr:hypothetical protein [bacterium]NUM66297.1 hypothetical protein [candidate division KSB1 bacterium]